MSEKKRSPLPQQQRQPYPADWVFQGIRPPVAQQPKEEADRIAQQQQQQVQM